MSVTAYECFTLELIIPNYLFIDTEPCSCGATVRNYGCNLLTSGRPVHDPAGDYGQPTAETVDAGIRPENSFAVAEEQPINNEKDEVFALS